MASIGGNIEAILQTKGAYIKNQIGEREQEWSNARTLTGWLDLSGGDSKYSNFSAKMQESTHVFICDFINLGEMGITSENARLLVNKKVYEILLIDNPMEMNRQLEIYLKYVGD